MTRPVTLSEPHFSQHTLNKYASLMAQGNGYLGLRASHEEDYTRQTRGMYLAGLYHRAGKGEINELVNLSLIHISEPTRREWLSRMPSSA